MKFQIELDDNTLLQEVMDACFIAYVKNIRKNYAEDILTLHMEEDIKDTQELIDACDVIIKNFTVQEL